MAPDRSHHMSLAEVRWIDIPHSDDDRGTLTVIEESALPFSLKRIFYMHRVPDGLERGGHAHRSTQQLAIAASGRFAMDLFDGERSATYVLEDPNRGLYLPAMMWMRLYGFAAGTVALVVCDRTYDAGAVIRDRDTYCRLRRDDGLDDLS